MKQRPVKKRSSTPPELYDLADQVGEFIQYWGFKKVHGRIWSHLFVSTIPLDASQLIDRLQISKALVSMSLHDLLADHVIEEAGKSDRSTQLYRANPDVMNVIIGVLRSREKRMLSRIESAQRLLRTVPENDRKHAQIDLEKVHLLGDMIQKASEGLDAIITFSEFNHVCWKEFNSSAE